MKKLIHTQIPIPVFAMLAVGVLYAATKTLDFLPDIFNARAIAAILLLALVLYAAIKNGIRSALTTTLVALAFFLYLYATPGKLLHYTDENILRITLIGITLTSLAILIDNMKQTFSSHVEEERLAREKAEIKAQKLEKSGDRKEEFLSIASHELKTPITSIKLGVHALRIRAQKEKDPQLTMHLTRIDNQINNLTSIINDMLDVSRMATGKLTLNKQECNIDQIINEKIEEISKLEETHRILKKGRTTRPILADKIRIGQVLTNLLTNAIRYSPHADKIIVEVHEEKDSLLIHVKDFGIGIAKAHQKKIFGRFYQVYASHKKGALGIGLYISSRIIKMHNGSITVQSKEGQGSTFSIVLPNN